VRVLVTGASRGLGLALCATYADRGADVLAVCRRSGAALDALPVSVAAGIDLGEDAAEPRLARAVGRDPVDVVVCNAAVVEALNAGLEDADPTAIPREYQVNALGPLRTLRAVLPNLPRGAKVAMLTTEPAPLAGRPQRPGIYGYRMSKAALNTLGLLLAAELRPRAISVVLLTPGPVATDMLRAAHRAGRTPRTPGTGAPAPEVARDLVVRIDELDLETSGSWLDRAGRTCRA